MKPTYELANYCHGAPGLCRIGDGVGNTVATFCQALNRIKSKKEFSLQRTINKIWERTHLKDD